MFRPNPNPTSSSLASIDIWETSFEKSSTVIPYIIRRRDKPQEQQSKPTPIVSSTIEFIPLYAVPSSTPSSIPKAKRQISQQTRGKRKGPPKFQIGQVVNVNSRSSSSIRVAEVLRMVFRDQDKKTMIIHKKGYTTRTGWHYCLRHDKTRSTWMSEKFLY